MKIRDHIQTIENYIRPVIEHPISQFTFQVVAEVVKIAAAKIILEQIGKRLLNDASKISPREVYLMTVLGPLVEEIIFRGALLRGIHLTQKSWNYLKENELSEEDQKAQLVFRVWVSSIIFSLAHLTNSHKHPMSAIIQCSWSFVGGLTYGYLSEKYHTLSVNYLAHGFNNVLAFAGRLLPASSAPFVLVGIVVNKLGMYILAVTTIDEYVVNKFREATSLVGRVVRGNNQEEDLAEMHV